MRDTDRAAFAEFSERVKAGDLDGMTDDELAAGAVLLTGDRGPGSAAQLVEFRREIKRREDAAQELADRRANGPTGPARVANPVGAVNEIAQMASSYQDRDAQSRLRRARAVVAGLPNPDTATDAEVKQAMRDDPRSLYETSALTLAWFRHFGEFEDLGKYPRYWQTGPQDDDDYTEPVMPLPGAKVTKAPLLWDQMKKQAIADRQAGDDNGAYRYTMAQARSYGIPFDPEQIRADETAARALGSKVWDASRDDPRTAVQQAASFIAEWRRLAAEAGDVDPDDALRYGPPDKVPGGGTDRISRAASTADQEIRINRMVAEGWDWEEAFADVHKIDVAELRQQAAAVALTGGAKPSVKVLRKHYEEHVHRQFLDAEAATQGHLLNNNGRAYEQSKKGKDAGFSAVVLFSGPPEDAYKYASEDLMRFWADNPRMTFADYKAMIVGDRRSLQANRRAAAEGNEFA